MRFSPAENIFVFKHPRSESIVSVEEKDGSALITFIDKENSQATLELSNMHDLTEFTDLLSGLKDKHYKEVRGLFDENVVFCVSYGNYGDPFEECIVFTFSIADPKKQFEECEIVVSLDLWEKKWFVDALSKCVK
ncbi:hypothetical protein [Psychromonas sp. SP041]|uniref:hypothetical protein n=1 Tax=Psychromonas sp. SP041 TaxID=1365007 RepID=UPI0010C7C15A|nr:hypothetical protein [Psychromonas sp. SP041]